MKPGEGGEELGDIWLLDTTRQALAWACVALPATLPSGPRPLQRCHAATRLGSSILFFGGGRSHTLTNGVSRFDTEAMAWAAPPALSGPPPCRRQNAAMELLPSTGAVVVFGGWRMGAMGQDVLLGDTYVLDLDAPQRAGAAHNPGGAAGEGGDASGSDGSGSDGPPSEPAGGWTAVGHHPVLGPLVDYHGQVVPLLALMQHLGGGAPVAQAGASGGESEEESGSEGGEESGSEGEQGEE
mmetsp:Transcript_33588/g.100329  ORF Transcript_33588/g.100329 Transcript_33588/m.100329 type:complete len:240 (+) Transcript_33588:1139-1858(+)